MYSLLVVFVSVGAVGLTYRTGMAQPRPTNVPRDEVAAEPAQVGDAPKAARPLADDLEALRLEVEALRRSLQATR